VNGLNATHDPGLRSWLQSANEPEGDFPVQNLPYGVFITAAEGVPRCGVAIGDRIIDITCIADLFTGNALGPARSCASSSLNALMAHDPSHVSAMRSQLSVFLTDEGWRAQIEPALIASEQAELLLPIRVGGYTDFFASIHHAANAGRLFRPDQPLLPNYKHVPIAYNGRANSVRVSGEPVVRPHGQQRPVPPNNLPTFAPSARLDHEVELGFVIGMPTSAAHPASPGEANEHIFGFCLLNDWSARDVQAWEYQPLGPFLAKSFATSISPWIVTAEALAPFRSPAATRLEGDPSPLPYLLDALDQAAGAVSVWVEAHLCTAQMRALGLAPHKLSRSNAASLYWTPGQMVAHHTSNGCKLDTGDLLGTGTISGPTDEGLGSLLEITAGGTRPFALPSGEERTFLRDGDEVLLSGFCKRAGHARIGFGECRAHVLPSHVHSSERSTP